MKRHYGFGRAIWLAAAVLVLVSSASAAAAYNPIYTVRGRALLPDGRPAVGIPLVLQATTPTGHDPNNTYWKIPNYDSHRVVTDARGEFVMTNVIDYPENETHSYVVSIDPDSDVPYHGSARFPLRPETTELRPVVQLDDVTFLRIHLKDRNGRPFEGTRAIWLNTGSGAASGDLANGYNQFKTARFVNGVATIKVPVRDKITRMGRFAVLDYPTADMAKKDIHNRGLKTGDTRFDALKFATRDVKGKSIDLPLKLLPQQTQDFEFTV